MNPTSNTHEKNLQRMTEVSLKFSVGRRCTDTSTRTIPTDIHTDRPTGRPTWGGCDRYHDSYDAILDLVCQATGAPHQTSESRNHTECDHSRTAVDIPYSHNPLTINGPSEWQRVSNIGLLNTDGSTTNIISDLLCHSGDERQNKNVAWASIGRLCTDRYVSIYQHQCMATQSARPRAAIESTMTT